MKHPVIARSEATWQSPLTRLLSSKAHPDHADTIALTTALLSILNQQGHSYAFIDEWSGQPLPSDGEEALPSLPPQDEWLSVLQASDLVGDSLGDEPLVLTGSGKLQFDRFYQAEQRIWQDIRDRLNEPPDEKGLAELQPLIKDLFGPPPEGTDINWQAVSAISALRHRFCVITGGPGTGKTFTVARVLALLLTREPSLRVALAAPTGKAANRLTESIREQLDDLPETVRAALGEEAKTIHRLLDYHPATDSFRFNGQRKLDANVLVVDEASMVGLALMDGLFQAMPEDGRIIILGDEYQLPSVDAGDLLAEICREAEKHQCHSSGFAGSCKKLTGYQLAAGKHVEPLRDAVIRLRHSYRFGKESGIGLLTEAVRLGDAGRALELLESDDYPEVSRKDLPEKVEDILESMIPFLEDYLKSKEPEEALQKLNELRPLSVTRWGSVKLNECIETYLRRSRMIGPGKHYHAQPIMVTKNDYQTNLFNGDVGVCWLEEGQVRVCFPTAGGELRRIPLSKLPPHEPAWALTVHKSQGSEFDRVILFGLDSERRPIPEKLIYTGITRARCQMALHVDGRDIVCGVDPL